MEKELFKTSILINELWDNEEEKVSVIQKLAIVETNHTNMGYWVDNIREATENDKEITEYYAIRVIVELGKNNPPYAIFYYTEEELEKKAPTWVLKALGK
ncbi:hypothetical protein [uncultured Fusobacterium sp.]|uniref:hypothetical protein n=1 Tax=uncultured Fusobacterium sp. TaxID=159267 RepID=UPI0015A696DE|nr:hypothetical protein [uncultured Fusobacterium sp.]